MNWKKQRCLRTLSRESGCLDQTSLISRALQIILILNMHFRSWMFTLEFLFKFLDSEAPKHKRSANTQWFATISFRRLFRHRYSRSHLQSCLRTIKFESPWSTLWRFSRQMQIICTRAAKRGSFSVVEKFRFPKPSARSRQKILEIPFAKCLFKSFNTVAAILSFLCPNNQIQIPLSLLRNKKYKLIHLDT